MGLGLRVLGFVGSRIVMVLGCGISIVIGFNLSDTTASSGKCAAVLSMSLTLCVVSMKHLLWPPVWF